MVIVDTTVWIDYLRGGKNPETDWLDRELTRRRLGLTDLILYEVLHGVNDSRMFAGVRSDLLKFRIFATGGEDLAIETAINYRDLQKRGHKVRRTIDCLIATFCLRERHQLLHRDQNFDVFEKVLGLRVVHP